MSETPYIVPLCHDEVIILYQDDNLLMIDKPTLLLSVPGKHPANRDCVITRIQQSLPRARIVHRLDMDTSGVMVLALNADSQRALNQQFAERDVHKEYEAVVYGLIKDDEGCIDLPLCCDWPNRPKQKVDFEHGKSAQTFYTVLSRTTEPTPQTRVLLKPITGRSHQLRVHLSHIEHPILGCDFYAHKTAYKQSSRLLLHARCLRLRHPLTGEVIEQLSAVPF